MDAHNALSAELPPPRDDEPASLRQDILDELADHLGCAYHRELLRGANPVEARLRVLNRFGDPAAVARWLWLDAMKGKIMAQRILIATCLVLTLASLSLTGVLYQQSVRAQRESAHAAMEAIQMLTLQNERAQTSQQEMLKQLREVSEGIRTTRSLDWNPVKFELTEETPKGPPAAGFLVVLNETEQSFRAVGMGVGGLGRGAPVSETSQDPSQRVTDRSGIADFGVVHPGDYLFQIVKAWDGGSVGTSGRIHIEPGSQINKRIVCPKTPPERVPVRVRFAWPSDLEKEKLVLYASFTLDPSHRDDLSWTLSDEWPHRPSARPGRLRALMGARLSATRSVFRGPETVAQVLAMKQPYLWEAPGVPSRGLWAQLRTSDLRDIKESEGTLTWEPGTYHLSGMLALRPIESGDLKAGKRRFEVIVASDPYQGGMSNGTYFVWNLPPPDDVEGGPRAKRSRPNGQMLNHEPLAVLANAQGTRGGSDVVIPWESWSKSVTSFEARPGQVNEWTITLPDELVQAARKRLKAAKS